MRRLRENRIRQNEEEAANPMDGVSNLADAMLVLAVGIMLALIINWQVDISTGTAQSGGGLGGNPLAIDGEDLSDVSDEGIDESGLQRVGSLYFDEETGMYYAISDAEE